TKALENWCFRLETTGDSISVSPNGETKPLELATEPYPGFPTDMQAQMCALLSTTDGISVITENIFPQRYMHVAELTRMGAHVDLEGATAVIQGVDHLFGAPVMASDLRASAALVLAGLKVDGFFVPWAGHILGPLIIWLAKRGDSPEIDEHGKESLNFQISMLIYNVIAGVLCLVLIGFVILGILHILNLVLVIVASIQASEG